MGDTGDGYRFHSGDRPRRPLSPDRRRLAATVSAGAATALLAAAGFLALTRQPSESRQRLSGTGTVAEASTVAAAPTPPTGATSAPLATETVSTTVAPSTTATTGTATTTPTTSLPPVTTSTSTFTTPPTSSPSPTVYTEADSGRSVSVLRGETIVVQLDGTPTDAWSAPTSSDGAVLTPTSTTSDPATGDGGGTFQAVKAGAADVMSTQDPACRQLTPPCARPSRSFVLHVFVV